MLTRTRTYENPDVAEGIPLPLTKEAKAEIDSKGFYLYKWISSPEVKASIQRDYLQILSKIGIWIGLIAILGGLLGGGGLLGFFFFFTVLGFSYFFIFIYLFILAIRRAMLLTNTANVVLTDTAISFGGDIIPYGSLESYRSRIEKWEKEFDEPLFGKSRIEERKNTLFHDVIESIGKGWKWAFKFFDNVRLDRGGGNLILIAILFGLVYTASTAVVYFAGLFFVWIFSLGFTLLSRFFLRAIGHKVQRIHDTFTEIDTLSEKLRKVNQNLSESLDHARANEWRDALLPKINTDIRSVGSLADTALTESERLKKLLLDSEYKDVFNFDRYHGWIRTQIIMPLRDIRDLLTQNHLLITTTISGIEKEIVKIRATPETTLIPHERAIGTLEVQKKRLSMQLQEFEKYGTLIDEYLKRLEDK